METSVHCSASHRGEQAPRRFLLEGEWMEVERILDRWTEPERRIFRVAVPGGGCYLLIHESAADRWTVEDPAGARGGRGLSGEADLWARATADVLPLPGGRTVPRPRTAGKRDTKREVAGQPSLSSAEFENLLNSGPVYDVTEDGERIEGRAMEVSKEILRRLKRGEMPVEGRIDLHTCTREQAEAQLDRFVAGSRAEGRRVVLVIHGRGAGSPAGGGILKRSVHAWLAGGRFAGQVLAFATAPPRWGGRGAVLLFLRR